MEARELVELAAIAATHGPVLIAESARLSEAGLHHYWTASKCRFDRWNMALKEFGSNPPSSTARPEAWPGLQSTLEEILSGEILARIWTVIASAHDRRHGREESEPIARSILHGQQEARNRVLRLIVQESSDASGQVQAMNTLRRRCERWTDVLLAYLWPEESIRELAFDLERVKDFAAGFRRQRAAGLQQVGWEMTVGALSAAFQTALVSESPNRDLNINIAASVLACFPAGIFDGTGLLQTHWMTRMQVTTVDAQGMIDELIALDNAPLRANVANS